MHDLRVAGTLGLSREHRERSRYGRITAGLLQLLSGGEYPGRTSRPDTVQRKRIFKKSGDRIRIFPGATETCERLAATFVSSLAVSLYDFRSIKRKKTRAGLAKLAQVGEA
jgi:hypothetical protein